MLRLVLYGCTDRHDSSGVAFLLLCAAALEDLQDHTMSCQHTARSAAVEKAAWIAAHARMHKTLMVLHLLPYEMGLTRITSLRCCWAGDVRVMGFYDMTFTIVHTPLDCV